MQADCIPPFSRKGLPMKTAFTSSLAGLALLVACATPNAAPVAMQSGVLTNADGMTLYVFDKDAANSSKSACNGDCATNWPPLMATVGDKTNNNNSIITRDDGSRQWAYKGKPLY